MKKSVRRVPRRVMGVVTAGVLAAGPFVVWACGGKTSPQSDVGTCPSDPTGMMRCTSSSSGSGSSGGFSGSTGGSSSGFSGSTGGSSSGFSGSTGGSSSGPSSSGGADDCANLPAGACIVPPPPPPAGPASSASRHAYAIHSVYEGDTDRSGNPSAVAWESFGYNLDGKITTPASTDVCTLAAGSAMVVQNDGNGGIDNSYGANILPIWATLDASFSVNVNDDIQAGRWTELSVVTGFDDTAGNQTSAVGLTGVELVGATTSAMPTWDLSMHWPMASEDLTCGSSCASGTDPVSSATMQFLKPYQSHGTFVSGAPQTLSLVQSFSGQRYTVPMHGGIVTFQPSAPGSVTGGVIAGAILVKDYISALHAIAGAISTTLCSGSAFASIAQQIQQTADIVVDPSTGAITNPVGVSCNAISIGLGFEGTEIAYPKPGDVTINTPPPTDTCGD